MALELSSKSWKIALSNAQKLVQMLMRYHRQGERTLWRVVRVPSQAEEDERRPHRERERLLGERTSHRNRLRGLLALHGVRVKSPVQLRLRELRDVGGQALPSALVADCEREAARLALLEQA
jgi:transposase